MIKINILRISLIHTLYICRDKIWLIYSTIKVSGYVICIIKKLKATKLSTTLLLRLFHLWTVKLYFYTSPSWNKALKNKYYKITYCHHTLKYKYKNRNHNATMTDTCAKDSLMYLQAE
jgi:hypothetical protein